MNWVLIGKGVMMWDGGAGVGSDFREILQARSWWLGGVRASVSLLPEMTIYCVQGSIAGLLRDVPLPWAFSAQATILDSPGLQREDCGQRPQLGILPLGMSQSARWGPGPQEAWTGGLTNSTGVKRLLLSFSSMVEKRIVLTSCKEEILQSLGLDHGTVSP